MENPLNAMKKEEIAKGGQMAVVIGFVATFLLGVVFVFLMGNLLGQVSDGVRQVNVELSGTKTLIVEASAHACLNATLRAQNTDTLANAETTMQEKLEAIINKYSAEDMDTLSSTVTNCTIDSLPSFLDVSVSSATVMKTGEGLTVESTARNILNM